MRDDYSMPTPGETGPNDDWQRGDLPGGNLPGNEQPSSEQPAGEAPQEPAPTTASEDAPAAPEVPAAAEAAGDDNVAAVLAESDDVAASEARDSAQAEASAPENGAAAEEEAAPKPRRSRRRAQSPAAPSLPLSGTLSLAALVESLLFVADGAISVSRLAEALEVHARDVEAALNELAESYAHRGISLQRFRDKVQLTTAAEAAPWVERFLGLAATTPLSRAALETLAIIAYQQPVTRPQIEAVRGVNSDSVIKNLLAKGLIEETGRAEGPGRPVLYVTTTEFMQHFGLNSLNDLPPLNFPEPEAGEGANAVPTPPPPPEILKG